ncbi:unnamed protein product [Mycena citricolor]|uniref:Uncharacterized protein n=1 Tax=Mycena citricolor TaxID=2018698 RepID=A0AAD2HVR1_9AGAR|nr:unnamed protein product [Mycena citricolor]
MPPSYIAGPTSQSGVSEVTSNDHRYTDGTEIILGNWLARTRTPRALLIQLLVNSAESPKGQGALEEWSKALPEPATRRLPKDG